MVAAWHAGRIRLVNPPRVLITGLSRGLVFGEPGDAGGQKKRLEAALALLARSAPLEPEYFEAD